MPMWCCCTLSFGSTYSKLLHFTHDSFDVVALALFRIGGLCSLHRLPRKFMQLKWHLQKQPLSTSTHSIFLRLPFARRAFFTFARHCDSLFKLSHMYQQRKYTYLILILFRFRFFSSFLHSMFFCRFVLISAKSNCCCLHTHSFGFYSKTLMQFIKVFPKLQNKLKKVSDKRFI